MAQSHGRQRRAEKHKKRRQSRRQERASVAARRGAAAAHSGASLLERCGYDAQHALPAADWLALDERERMARVERYHLAALRTDQLPPSMLRHAGLHVSVENQLAEDTPPQVTLALTRLMAEGMSRHDAVHALGSVTMDHMRRALEARRAVDNDAYVRELEELTVERWLARARSSTKG